VFAAGLKHIPHASLVAGASRSSDRASTFQQEFQVPRCYASYEEIYADPEVDAIYIATRHPDHASAALDSIRAGKPVLIEKPFTMNCREAKLLVEESRRNNVFCMEAMWTRFLPLMSRLRAMLKEGIIGDVRLVQADFAFCSGMDASSRIFDPEKGG